MRRSLQDESREVSINQQLVSLSPTAKAISGDKRAIGLPVIALAILISSYFYVLPLGRFSFAGFLSDFRLYDFAFVFFFLTIGLRYWNSLITLWRDSTSFFRWAVFLLYLVWMSIGVAYFIGGNSAYLFPTLIRAFRFTAFFIASGYAVVLVKTRRQYEFIIIIIYINILIQALLGFAQGIGILPGLWPDYWLVGYGFRPVGTLSPHHKQMGIVMLLGIGMTIGFIRSYQSVSSRFFLLAFLGLMVAVPIMAGSRTAWLGYGAGIAGAIIVLRGRAFSGVILSGIFLMLSFQLSGELVQTALQESVDARFMDRLNNQGIEGIVGERLPIYASFLSNIVDYPWVIILGAGFQNVDLVVAGTGAHNNYLQAFIELGFIGFIVYVLFLRSIWQQLRLVAQNSASGGSPWHMGDGLSIFFVALLGTMLVGESLWAQYSMFTLTGQIMTTVGVVVAPLYWTSDDAATKR